MDLSSLLESLPTNGVSIPINDFDFNPWNEYSFFSSNGTEHEIVTGLTGGVPVIKVRYGSKRTPHVLFKDGSRYFLNIYSGRDEDNRVQFSEVYGTISPKRVTPMELVRERKPRSLKPRGGVSKTSYTKEGRPSRQERAIVREYGSGVSDLEAMLNRTSLFGKRVDSETKYLLRFLK